MSATEAAPLPFADPAEAPVVHVAFYEQASDYEDADPFLFVGIDRAEVEARMAAEVAERLAYFAEECDDETAADFLDDPETPDPAADPAAYLAAFNSADAPGTVLWFREPVHGVTA